MDKKYPKMKKSECYKKVRVFDYQNIKHYMYEHGHGNIELMAIFPDWARIGNDSHWSMYKNDINDMPEYAKNLFNLLDSIFHFPEDEEIIFWISW
jgi:hypothetical protein